MSTIWQCGRYAFNCPQPLIMGVVNVTPDSFSDGGLNFVTKNAVRHAQLLIENGAQIIDIGGESTRPGASGITIEHEINRVMPVLKALLQFNVAISVDTRKPEVMRAALEAGADMINDIDGFRNPVARQIVSQHPSCGLCMMHMQGEPSTMQHSPSYTNVVTEVVSALKDDAQALISQGVNPNRISLDPGFGFGKTIEHNYLLLAHLDQLVALGFPVLIGLSRKSMIGTVIDKPVDQRVMGSVAGAVIALERGAMILRVHDVDATQDAVKVWQATQQRIRA